VMFGTFVVTLSSAWLRRYAYLHFAACLDHRMEAQFRRCPGLRGPNRRRQEQYAWLAPPAYAY
jgi:hypothetical protein